MCLVLNTSYEYIEIYARSLTQLFFRLNCRFFTVVLKTTGNKLCQVVGSFGFGRQKLLNMGVGQLHVITLYFKLRSLFDKNKKINKIMKSLPYIFHKASVFFLTSKYVCRCAAELNFCLFNSISFSSKF